MIDRCVYIVELTYAARYISLPIQQTSKTLARLIGRMTHILEEEYIQLLRCFLDPKKMFHKEAAPIPINPQTQLFQVTGENKVVPVQHRGHKYDPIYDLFNPRNIAKQG